MDSSCGGKPPQQKDSHKIKTPPPPFLLQPLTKVQANVGDFRTLVQRLTGLTSSDFSNAGDVSPATPQVDDGTAKDVRMHYEQLVMVRNQAIKSKVVSYWDHLQPILVHNTDTGLPKAVNLRCSLCDAVFSDVNPSRTASDHLKSGICPNFNSAGKPSSLPTASSITAVHSHSERSSTSPHITSANTRLCGEAVYSPTVSTDIEQILLDAQYRWLRPAEIYGILQNHKKFIASEPPNMPPSGSLFLFDHKVLRFFRDGHKWRKKKDGKTVTEAHEILKVGSVDVLHCYCAHGEENENFQRRSYWTLDKKLAHIVLVHYRELKGNWANFNLVKEAEETIPYSQEIKEIVPNSTMESSVSSSFHPNNYRMPPQTRDSTSLNSVQASEYEAAESDKYQGKLSVIPGMHSTSLAPEDNNKDTNDAGLTFKPREHLDFSSWDTKEIYFMDNELYELPESPICPSLIALYLQRNYGMTIIPPLFFEHMPVLQVLNLSHTSIKSLPESLPKLVALRKLLLRGCELFMELSPQVGELKNLEELDLDETQIIYLPVEIGKLVKLKSLKVSFYGDMKCSKKRLQSSTLIHTGVISSLSQLTELSIDVNPDDKRWNATVESIIEEVCSLKMLDTLCLYLPKVELLKKHEMGSRSLIHHPLSRFSFVVGHHKRRIISRVPDEVEAHFKEGDKCLKFVNGRDIPDEITKVLKNATAFYLERNVTAVNLSEFGIENMEKLKFCILAECNEMQTIIDGGGFSEERSDKEEGGQGCYEFEYDSDFAEEVVLGSLVYLGIYYMNNLRSIWEGPINVHSLSNLKFLAIHTCPKLSTIFSVDFLANLIKLEELIIEDCPQVTCLVSHASSNPTSVTYLPSLRKISLLFLPELVSISSGLHIAPELERIGFYYCPKLENLSTTELSNKNLKVIKGERKWWDEALKWNESDWGSRPDHLNDIFCEIDEEKDVMAQLTEQQ